MPSEVILPRVDMDMATGKISKWLASDGTRVEKGQPLFEIETDKAAMEIEAEASGTLHTLTGPGGEDLAVGSVVALIYGEGEPAAAKGQDSLTASRASTAAAPPPAHEEAPGRSPRDAVPTATTDRRRATPLARRLARERGLDLSALSGSGPHGRLQAADVPGPAAAEHARLEESRSIAAPIAMPAAAVEARPPQDTGRAVPRERVSDGALATLRDGEDTPVVLIHGFGSETDAWRPFLQGYSGGRRVLALDLPGHGGAPLGADAGFAALVDKVEATLLASGLPALNIVGHSLGGAVATAIAARGALDLRSLLLLSPAGLGPDICGAFIGGYLASGSEASLAPWLRELVADPAAVTPAFVRATLKAREPALDGLRRLAAALFPDGTQAFSIRDDLARVACPTRVVVGTADRIIPARHADGLPGLVALHRLAAVGHMPQLEARETVQAILSQTTRS